MYINPLTFTFTFCLRRS